ncbi:MAG: 4Fe-4S dicluster domain-containing protein [Planctomycetes bacterium]|nr:4Fe-4S dicluster domain-containing protein [Planctomycetota bacterium]
MPLRQIIKIDEDKCTGCGECIPGCPEGALQVIDGKARLISDLFCDGLGACLGTCPVDAIAIEEREAEPYDERRVMENIARQGPNTINAHLEHLREHGEFELLKTALDFLKERGIGVPRPAPHAGGGCPGSRAVQFEDKAPAAAAPSPLPLSPGERGEGVRAPSRLRQWPVQITLVPPQAPYLKGADVVLVADCVPFAYASFHEDFLKGRVVLVGCPKLDDVDFYRRKLAEVFRQNDIKSIEVVHMEVPCCFGLVHVLRQALADSGKDIPATETTISLRGEVLEKAPLD